MTIREAQQRLCLQASTEATAACLKAAEFAPAAESQPALTVFRASNLRFPPGEATFNNKKVAPLDICISPNARMAAKAIQTP
jgi:hypothetical protein